MDAVRHDRTVHAEHSSKVAGQKLGELGSFLTARRAEVTPQEVGLPNIGPRRISGLRREEVAMLAGVGASWYTWIEQGRAKNVSPSILAAIADVLRLNEIQWQYMMRLAGYTAPTRPVHPLAIDCDLGCSVVDGFLPNPAYFLDQYWNIVVANAAAEVLLGIEGECNYLDLLFGHPRAQQRFPFWEQDSQDAVGRLRAQCAELVDDPRLNALVHRLRGQSRAFAEVWDRHHISNEAGMVQTVHHPEAGRISLTRLCLEVAGRPGLRLVLLQPGSTGAADTISWLAGASRS